jgi:hypothetical protein
MAGKIKKIIDTIIEKRARGNETLIATTKAKLLLKGINPAKFGPDSDDDTVIIKKLQTLANDLGIRY